MATPGYNDGLVALVSPMPERCDSIGSGQRSERVRRARGELLVKQLHMGATRSDVGTAQQYTHKDQQFTRHQVNRTWHGDVEGKPGALHSREIHCAVQHLGIVAGYPWSTNLVDVWNMTWMPHL